MDDETIGYLILKGSTGANAGKLSRYLLKGETKKNVYTVKAEASKKFTSKK